MIYGAWQTAEIIKNDASDCKQCCVAGMQHQQCPLIKRKEGGFYTACRDPMKRTEGEAADRAPNQALWLSDRDAEAIVGKMHARWQIVCHIGMFAQQMTYMREIPALGADGRNQFHCLLQVEMGMML
jgi:hypothetical protein